MRKKFLSLLALLCMTASGAWAQTTSDVGKVIAANGKMYNTVTLANKVSTASGVVAYVGTTSGCVCPAYPDDRVIAIAISNTGNDEWGSGGCTAGDAAGNVSTAITRLNGNATTFALYNEHISSADGHHTHTPAYKCRTLSVAKPSGGHEWFLPSAGQWNLIVKGLTGSSSNLSMDANSALSISNVNAKITAAGGSGIAGNMYLSTVPSSSQVWVYNEEGRLYMSYPRSVSYTYRAAFTFASATNAYVVDYDANGGSGAPSAQSKDHGSSLTLSSTVPTRDGYTFAGWNTQADGLGTSYAAGATYTANADVTLYAKWTQNTATLTNGDDLSALATWAGKTCTVTYSRSFTSGKASTVCLPFAYTKQGTEGSFYEFTSITEEGGEYVATMTEPGVSTLTANTPYLFLPSATGSVDFGGTYAIPADLTAGSTTSSDWKFVGTYTTQQWTEAPTGIYGFSAQDVGENISQGEFVKVGAYVKVKPMRCYLEYKNGGEDYAAARRMTRAATADEQLPETIKVRLVSANGDVTAIGTLHTQTGEVVMDGWYTLDGTRLNGQPTRKGIYVNNGKKVIIK